MQVIVSNSASSLPWDYQQKSSGKQTHVASVFEWQL